MFQAFKLLSNALVEVGNPVRFGDTHVAVEPVMTFLGPFIGKQAKEEEHITNPDALIGEMRLGSIALPKYALAIDEHRIVVTKVAAIDASSRYLFDQIA